MRRGASCLQEVSLRVASPPSVSACVKAGDICDYSVRLNWEGRRTKRSAPSKGEFNSAIVPSKRFRWHHHDFSTKNGQTVEVSIEDNQGLESSSSFDHQPKQFRSPPSCIALTDPDKHIPATCSNHEKNYTGDTLTFIDESLQLHAGPTNRGSYVGRRRLDASKNVDLSRPPHKRSQLDVTTSWAHRENDKSFAELAKLGFQLRQCATPSAEHAATASSTTLFSCPITADELRMRATSSCNNHIAHSPNLGSFRSSNFAESWVVGDRVPRELAKQSGCLWESLDLYRFQEPLSHFHVYPHETGTIYAFEDGEMNKDLQQSAGDNASLLSHGTHIPKQSIVYFGE
ncbi:hypothetical protein E4U21_005428 [Claviceps maximensis]|nr:hypothetical protein E4U21_005428 [Claviceps maximensis]